MEATKHTPGPWKWDPAWGAVVSCGNVTRIVCPMWTGCNRATMSDADSAIDQANARLIAAAPDLVEALSNMLKASEDWALLGVGSRANFQTQARAALAKARL